MERIERIEGIERNIDGEDREDGKKEKGLG